MINDFQIKALPAIDFQHFFHMEDQELESNGGIRIAVDSRPGFPCRISLADANIGEEVILLPFKHHEVNSPYQASGPIFIRKNVPTAQLEVNEIPLSLKHRFLSLRAYDSIGMMKNALTVIGKDLQTQIEFIFSDPQIEYIHVHNANPGCYSCAIYRVVE